MYYMLTTWVFMCDGCKAKDKVVGDDLKLPEGWLAGKDIAELREFNYNQYIGDYNKQFCPKCIEKIEIKEIFK